MKTYTSDAIRNIAILGHGDSGKTSLVSAMLFDSGTLGSLGDVTNGTATTDFAEDEIDKQISLAASIAYAIHKDTKINIIDTPGYANFIHEAKAALPAADTALINVCGVSGVEVMTERVFRYTREQHLPTAFVINKLDRDNSNFDKVYDEINEVFDRRAVAIHMPIGAEADFKGVVDLIKMKAFIYKGDGSKEFSEEEIPADVMEKAQEMNVGLQEMIAENDEELMDHYFEAGELTQEEMTEGLKRAVRNRLLFPLSCVSATHNIGVGQLLNAIVDFFPNPLERKDLKALDAASGEEVDVEPAEDGPVSTFVFKTVIDPFAGRLTYMRVYSGQMKNETSLVNVKRGSSEKINHLVILQGKDQEHVDALACGDIGAVAKLKDTHTFDTLCDSSKKITYEFSKFSDPVIAYALEPKSRADQEKVSTGLGKLMEEDFMLRSERDPQTKELLVKGTGQQHIEIIIERLKKKFNCEVILHPPKVPYRETITGNADVRARHKKQSGGSGQFAECAIKMAPNDRDAGYEFIDEIFGGSISQGYRPAVDKGIQEAAQRGVLAGYPLVDFKVTLYDGKEHSVDSSEMAFKTAGSKAFKEAAQKAKPVLLEPVMEVEINVPEDNTGDVMGDLSSRRGRPLGMEPGLRGSVIKAHVAMSEMLTYAADLTAMTGGRGSFHMEFSHYDIVPQNIAQKIIEQAKKEEEEE